MQIDLVNYKDTFHLCKNYYVLPLTFCSNVPLLSSKAFTIREYRFVIYWLMDLPVVGYYGGFTYKHPITIL